MNRRRFIYCLSGLLALSVWPLQRALLRREPELKDLLANLAGTLPYDSTAIGALFIQQAKNIPIEMSRVEADLAVLARFENTEQQRKHFSQLCASEFARGETTVIDGWVLSNTELRCCAMKALIG